MEEAGELGETVVKRVALKPSTKSKLESLAKKGESYDDLINKLICIYQGFCDERAFHRWVLENHEILGFKEILKSNIGRGFPDLVVVDFHGRKLRVELEIESGDFIRHGHDPKGVDLILCIHKDKEILGVQVEEILPYERESGGCVERRKAVPFRRLYVFKETYNIVKMAAEREGKLICDLIQDIITESLDEKGRRKRVVLSDETLQPLLEWANEIKVSPEELILMLVSTVRTLFDPNLSLADALRSIPSLAKDLGITKAKGKPLK